MNKTETKIEPAIDETDAVTPVDCSNQALQALRWFYERLTLNDTDRKSLFKRGLIDATIDALGFRSNPETNRVLLQEMPNHFPMEVLLESGLWKMDAEDVDKPAKPNPQFYGRGIVAKRDSNGKKVRDENGEVIHECVWNFQILIPYFDSKGELFHLRPHKGMMAGKTPQLYVVRPRGIREGGREFSGPQTRQMAVITEGEFKAAALWQVLGDVAQIAALPGITMAKPLISDIEEWLDSSGVREVVVGYDNEEKSDEKHPGYTKDKRKRFDAHIWARFLARQLSKLGYEGKVCVLPDAWRDAKGKADWDGRLSAIIKENNVTDGSEASWAKFKGVARSDFLGVLQGARPIGDNWHANFFDKETERIIRAALDKISYEPCLPIGGQDEQALAKRLHRMASRLKSKDWFPLQALRFLRMLAKSYQATSGRYYRMKPLSEKLEDYWDQLRQTAEQRADQEARRLCDLVLRGRKNLKDTRRGHIPETISDFYFRWRYVLHRVNGTRCRVVTVHTVHGSETLLLIIPWDEVGSPVKVRDWLHRNTTGASWDGGQSELTALHEDMAHALAFKDVTEVPVRGYHAKSGIWFFEDVAFTDEDEFLPDPKTKIFWIKRNGEIHGYSFVRDADGRARDREDDVFRQGAPHMHPETKETVEEARTLFIEMLRKLKESLGEMEACMALGIVFACAAGPEIFKKWSCFPGLWIHGEQGEGKSALVRWLIRIWGFAKDKGLPLPVDDQRTTLTLAALSGALGQYGELPLWLDEYQCLTASWVRGILKNSYDRAEGAKKDFGGSPREYLAAVIVSGVATSNEPQTRSRFAHIMVDSKRRTADHYQWFQTNSLEFYRFGRFVLRHRKKFVESLMAAMEAWERSDVMKGVDDRARMVHGLAYAGFHAVCEIFNVPASKDLDTYWKWLAEHCKRSATDIKEQGIVDLFWRELMNAHNAGAFGYSKSDLQRYFQVIDEKKLRAPISEHQLKAGADESYKAWKSYFFYFKPGPVIELIRAFKRRGGGDLQFSQGDLQNQMKTRDYWHPPKHASGHRQKFGGKSTHSCWCIRVDLHVLGYIQISDAEFDESFVNGPELMHTSDTWVDPRKGDLFAIIDILLSKNNQEES